MDENDKINSTEETTIDSHKLIEKKTVAGKQTIHQEEEVKKNIKIEENTENSLIDNEDGK